MSSKEAAVTERYQQCLAVLGSRPRSRALDERKLTQAFRQAVRDLNMDRPNKAFMKGWRNLNISTWDEFQYIMLAFLRGELPGNYTYVGRFDLYPESQAQGNVFEDLTRLGLISQDSQPGVCKRGQAITYGPHANQGRTLREEQRPYISGVMDRELALALYCALKAEHNDLDFAMIVSTKDGRSTRTASTALPLGMTVPGERHQQRINLTRTRLEPRNAGDDAEEEEEEEWKDFSNQVSITAYETFPMQLIEKFMPALYANEDVCCVTLIGQAYCDTTFPYRVRDALAKLDAHMDPKRRSEVAGSKRKRAS